MVFFVADAVAFEDVQKPFPGFVVRQVMADGRVVDKGARGFGYDNQRNRRTFELAFKGRDEFNRGMPVKVKQQDIGSHFLIIQAELVQIIRVEQKIAHFFEILVVKLFVDAVVIVQENVAQVLHIVPSLCCCFCVEMPEYLPVFNIMRAWGGFKGGAVLKMLRRYFPAAWRWSSVRHRPEQV